MPSNSIGAGKRLSATTFAEDQLRELARWCFEQDISVSSYMRQATLMCYNNRVRFEKALRATATTVVLAFGLGSLLWAGFQPDEDQRAYRRPSTRVVHRVQGSNSKEAA